MAGPRRAGPRRGVEDHREHAGRQGAHRGPDADKHAALTAITDAVHGKGKHVLAMPATDTTTAFADTHRYAGRLTHPATPRRRLDDGEWTIPAGTLLVIDDADHLDAKQLRYVTEYAARSNTKLLLVHTPTQGRDPAHSIVDAMAYDLPWAQHVGTPTRRDTALDRAATHLADHEPVTAEDRDAAELLARRDTLQTTYPTQHHPGLDSKNWLAQPLCIGYMRSGQVSTTFRGGFGGHDDRHRDRSVG